MAERLVPDRPGRFMKGHTLCHLVVAVLPDGARLVLTTYRDVTCELQSWPVHVEEEST